MIPVYFVVTEHRGKFSIELMRPTKEMADSQAERISRQNPKTQVYVLLATDAYKNGERA